MYQNDAIIAFIEILSKPTSISFGNKPNKINLDP